MRLPDIFAIRDFDEGRFAMPVTRRPKGDHALANITHLTSSGAIISKFDYAYSAPGQIGEWTQQQGAQTPAKYSFGYDDVDQLRDTTARDTASQTVLKRSAYHYDPAGNRTTEGGQHGRDRGSKRSQPAHKLDGWRGDESAGRADRTCAGHNQRSASAG